MSRLIFFAVVGVLVVASYRSWLDEPSAPQAVDPRLEAAVQGWRHDMERTDLIWQARFERIESISIERLPQSKAGCYDHWSHRISLSPEQLVAGPYSTRATIYHELGHAVFLLKHSSCKLMGPAEEESYYREHWAELVSEYIIAANNKSNFTP